LFKNAFGKSPHAYLTEVRILNAKKLLEENHSIKEVCFDVGFESIPSFIGLFKKYVGITPSRFVKEKNRQNELKQLSPFSFVPNCFAEIHGWIE